MASATPSVRRVDSVNVLYERSRLAPDALARWQGLPLGWFDAAAKASDDRPFVTHPLLALLDAGQAVADFDFGSGLTSYELRPGALRVFDGQRVCQRTEWSCRSARRIMVRLDAGRFGEADLLAGLRQDLDFRDDDLAGILRAMVREVAEGCPHGMLFAESLSLAVLLRLQASHGRHRRERGVLTPNQIRRIDDLIAAGAAGEVSLSVLASTTGYSKAQFARLFRRTTGTPPHRYVLRHRLRHARRLIETTTVPLAEVALDSGFASQSHMTNAFVRHFDCTPGTLRREAAR